LLSGNLPLKILIDRPRQILPPGAFPWRFFLRIHYCNQSYLSKSIFSKALQETDHPIFDDDVRNSETFIACHSHHLLMTRVMTFRMPDDSLWSTEISPHPCVKDIAAILSGFWKISTHSVFLWDIGSLLRPEDKVMVCVNEKTGEDRIVSVTVGCYPVAPRITHAQTRDARTVDIHAIDPAEQVRIYERIQKAQIQENFRRAQALNGNHSLGRQVRTILCRIHGKNIRMIVDTGASLSILYLSHVQFCSATYLIDTRDEYRPTLVGIGDHANEVVGVIHGLEVAIGCVKTRCGFAVLDKPGEFGLLGLDWLNSVQATIRVWDDSIDIQGTVFKFQDP
jgi:hypothetical protein